MKTLPEQLLITGKNIKILKICLLNILKHKLTPRTCNFWGLKLFENIRSVTKNFIFFLWPFLKCVSTLYHIHFKFISNNIYNLTWKFFINFLLFLINQSPLKSSISDMLLSMTILPSSLSSLASWSMILKILTAVKESPDEFPHALKFWSLIDLKKCRVWVCSTGNTVVFVSFCFDFIAWNIKHGDIRVFFLCIFKIW